MSIDHPDHFHGRPFSSCDDFWRHIGGGLGFGVGVPRCGEGIEFRGDRSVGRFHGAVAQDVEGFVFAHLAVEDVFVDFGGDVFDYGAVAGVGSFRSARGRGDVEDVTFHGVEAGEVEGEVFEDGGAVA